MKNRLIHISNSCILISFALFILSLSSTVNAFEMSNDYFKIKGGGFNSFSGKSANQNYKVDYSSEEKSPDNLINESYTLRTGFIHTTKNQSFSFSISNKAINFGKLNPGEPILRTNILNISTGNAPGFQVSTYENHELQSASGQTIPDTTCDTGTCTETSGDLWQSPLTYGFGYRCDNLRGDVCDENFSGENIYKQFPNNNKSEEKQILISSDIEGNKSAEITYKINIAASQPTGIYENVIYYIALPSI